MTASPSYYRQMRQLHYTPAKNVPAYEFEHCYTSLLESDTFLLSARQRRELACILEEFKNRPLNQKNYIDLQRELSAAELLPTQIFCYDLGEEHQHNGNRYMSRIVQSWQKMSSRGTL